MPLMTFAPLQPGAESGSGSCKACRSTLRAENVVAWHRVPNPAALLMPIRGPEPPLPAHAFARAGANRYNAARSSSDSLPG